MKYNVNEKKYKQLFNKKITRTLIKIHLNNPALALSTFVHFACNFYNVRQVTRFQTHNHLLEEQYC